MYDCRTAPMIFRFFFALWSLETTPPRSAIHTSDVPQSQLYLVFEPRSHSSVPQRITFILLTKALESNLTSTFGIVTMSPRTMYEHTPCNHALLVYLAFCGEVRTLENSYPVSSVLISFGVFRPSYVRCNYVSILSPVASEPRRQCH